MFQNTPQAQKQDLFSPREIVLGMKFKLHFKKFWEFCNPIAEVKKYTEQQKQVTQIEVALQIASDQTVPDKCDLWLDRPRPKGPLIRLVCTRRS